MMRFAPIKPQRISKWLVQLGYCETRRETDYFLEDHVVMLEDNRIERGDIKITPDQVSIDGEAMDPARLILLLNKPAGYVSSHLDSGLRVYDLLPERYRRRNPKVVTVGRLDKDTTGLLIFTDDGALSHYLTHPKHHVTKRYEVTLAEDLKGNEAEIFAAGNLMLSGEDKPLLPAKMEVLGAREAVLEIREGRFHQVKRMFEAVGNEVAVLHRSRFGSLSLDGVAEGEWRVLEESELEALASD